MENTLRAFLCKPKVIVKTEPKKALLSKFIALTVKQCLYVLVMSRTRFRVNPHSIVA